MKKQILIIIVFLAGFLLFSLSSRQTVHAVDVLNNDNCGTAANSTPCSGVCNNPDASSKPTICGDNQSTSNTDPLLGSSGIITDAISVIAYIVGVAAIIVIIIGSLRMILAGGDSNNVAAARSTVIYALVGLAVAALAQLIVVFVLSKVS